MSEEAEAAEGGEEQAAASLAGMLNEENAAYLSLKNWGDDPNTVIERYRDLEKFKGVPAERLVQLPESAEDEKWREVWGKLGMPESADAYDVTVPDDLPISQERLSSFKKVAHKVGLTQAQAAALAEWDAGLMGSARQQSMEETAHKAEQDAAALRSEWGEAYDKKLGQAKAAAREFAVDEEMVDMLESVMGYGNVMRFFANVGSKLGEHQTVESDRSAPGFQGQLTPAEAKVAIENLRLDKDFMSKYIQGDKVAVDRMNRLHAASMG